MASQPQKDAVSEAAEQRFSDTDSAQKWTDMYASNTERLDEANFRRRRDLTVEYVLKVLPPGGRVLDVGCGADQARLGLFHCSFFPAPIGVHTLVFEPGRLLRFR